MHLPKNLILSCLGQLKRLLKPQGVLYLSWRGTEGTDQRHADGRLYTAFEPDLVLGFFEKSSLLHFEDCISSSSGRRICRLILVKAFQSQDRSGQKHRKSSDIATACNHIPIKYGDVFRLAEDMTPFDTLPMDAIKVSLTDFFVNLGGHIKTRLNMRKSRPRSPKSFIRTNIKME